MSQLSRQFSPVDALISRLDRRLRGLHTPPAGTRPTPGANRPEAELSPVERRLSAALMRVNHSGEVCAQALYRGQALTARQPTLRAHLRAAAGEETDHLVWCAERLQELNDHTSYLNPLWFAGAYTIGSLAGLSGDRWSLGFVAETERQVEQHLQGHRQRLPAADYRSHAIVEQMQLDEARHGRDAMNAGGVSLPWPLRLAMRLSARVMTTTAHWV